MQGWIVALIGVGGPSAAQASATAASRAINRDDRAAALREQMRTAVADYFGLLVVSVAELRDLPLPRSQMP